MNFPEQEKNDNFVLTTNFLDQSKKVFKWTSDFLVTNFEINDSFFTLTNDSIKGTILLNEQYYWIISFSEKMNDKFENERNQFFYEGKKYEQNGLFWPVPERYTNKRKQSWTYPSLFRVGCLHFQYFSRSGLCNCLFK